LITLNEHASLRSAAFHLPARVQPSLSLHQISRISPTIGEQGFVQSWMISPAVSSTIPVPADCIVSILCRWGDCQHTVTATRRNLRKRFIAHFQDNHSDVVLGEKTHKKPCCWTSCRCACHRKNRCEPQGGSYKEHAAHILDIFSHVWKNHALPQLKEM
jgi:hypothetical protein